MTTMKKIVGKLKKLTQIQLVLILSAAVFFTGGIMTLADSTDLTIRESYGITGKTNSYNFSTGNYYTTVSSTQTLSVVGNNVNSDDTAYAQYDLVLVGADDTSSLENVSVSGKTADSKVNGALCYRDNNLDFGSTENVTISNPDGAVLDVYVFRAYTKDGYHHNEYITNFFAMQMLKDENEHNSDENNTAIEGSGTTPADYAEIKSYRNIYVLKDLTANEELTLNIPCYINLLKSNIRLEKPMSIKHNYGGLFAIEGITGKIDNSAQVFTIDAPKAYYLTDVYSAFTDYSDTQLVKKTLGGGDYTAEILADAEAYIDNFVPKFIFDDILLPDHYNQYGITYTYEVSNDTAFKTSGKVQRGSENSTFDLTYHIFLDGVEQGTGTTITRTVAGTSQAALSAVLNEELGDYLALNSTAENDKIYLERAVDVKLLLDQFIRDSKTTYPINISFDKSGLYFDVNSLNNVSLAKNLEVLDMTYSSGYIVKLSSSKSENYSNIETIILRESKFVATNQLIKISTKVGTAAGIKSVTLRGLTIPERNNLLERYKSAVYYTSVNDIRDILNYKSDGIYNGSQRVIDSDMSLTKLDYQIYYVDSSKLDEPVDIEELTKGSTEFSGSKLLGTTADSPYFTMTDGGQLELLKEISLTSGKLLVLVSTASYSDDETAGKEYLSYQEIIIPANGIGGDAYSVYTSGDTFADEFANGPYLSFPDPFVSGNSGVKLVMTVTAIDGEPPTAADDFVAIRTVDEKSYIDIDISKVPSQNTNVTVTAVFSVNEKEISTQNYTFTIPGIYRLGTEFDDVWVYLRMLETYGDYKGYLLANSAQGAPLDGSGKFDCTQEKLKAIHDLTNGTVYNLDYLVSNNVITSEQAAAYTFSDSHSLKGIDLLTGTAAMSFDNVKPVSLTPFSSFSATNSKLVELSMKNCGLSDVKELYNLNNLKKCNLDDNSISKIGGSLYRTVTELSLSNQGTALDDISDISTLPNLTTLRIENNAIKDFRPLYDLSKLTTVYLGGNLTAGGYYGTHGSVNLCNYVALVHKGITVYVENDKTVVILPDGETATNPVLSADGYEISLDEEYLCVAINSIMNMNTYTTAQIADGDMVHDLREEISGDTTKTNYATTIIDSESVSNDHYVVHITDGTLDIYRYIKLNK